MGCWIPVSPSGCEPGMLILRKLLQDVPAMLGLLIVVIAVVLAFIPELLVSDMATANRGNIMVRLKPICICSAPTIWDATFSSGSFWAPARPCPLRWRWFPWRCSSACRWVWSLAT